MAWNQCTDQEKRGKHLSLRVWQRFINARKLVYEKTKPLYSMSTRHINKYKVLNRFLTHLESLQNIQFVRCKFGAFSRDDTLFLNALSLKSNKIRQFRASATRNSLAPNVIPKIKLFDATKIRLHNIQLPVIVSHNCQNLSLVFVSLNKIMCETMIYDCDLTGIKKLSLRDIKIKLEYIDAPVNKDRDADGALEHGTDSANAMDLKTVSSVPDNDNASNQCIGRKMSKDEICQLLAQQMRNVERLDIRGLNDDTLKLLKALNDEIRKNGGKCNLSVSFDDVSRRGGRRRRRSTSKAQDLEPVNFYKSFVIPFFVENNISIDDVKFILNQTSLDIAYEIFNRNEICKNIQILRINGATRGKNRLQSFIANYISNFSIERINFTKLLCFSVNLSMYSIDDVRRGVALLKCRFNYNYNYNYSSNSSDNNNENNLSVNNSTSKEILWYVIFKIRWPVHSGHIAKLKGSMKNLWKMLDQLFIQTGNPIDLHVLIYSYAQGSDRLMKQEYMGENIDEQLGKDKDTCKFKRVFLDQFGDWAYDKKDRYKKNLVILRESKSGAKYKVPKGHDYCKSLEKPEIWCKFHKETQKKGASQVCRIDFCVKNAVYQRWKIDFG